MTLSDQFFDLENFKLESGHQLSVARQSYITLGSLNTRADNAILVLHGYTSSHRFILPQTYGAADGSWHDLVGPGKAIDTDKYFVLAPNALGSSYGSTGPASIDPLTGKPYGSKFAALSFRDLVRAQRALVNFLGISRLHAVLGFSMGGYNAFQWATDDPGAMRKVVAALTAPWGNRNDARSGIKTVLARNPNWNDGWYYDRPCAMTDTMQTIRLQTLKSFGVGTWLANQGMNKQQIDERLGLMASNWARDFDANSLVTLREMINRFDVREQLHTIQAQMLYVLARTDTLFPPSIASETFERMTHNQPEFLELDSDYGHFAGGLDHQRWAGVLTRFLAQS